jgi:dolichyl-phosphate-mannose-protein mannosyltransferase
MIGSKITKQSQFLKRWFWPALLGIWLFSLGLRFWGLERFNTLVFDEVYFARFGHNYLTRTPLFDAHPPLGKYMIALGIWLQGSFTPFGYRWMNALVGACLPLLIGGIAFQLTRRYSYALIAALLASADGLLLVESRYGLINVHLLFFGLLGQWLLLLALQKRGIWQWIGLGLAAIALSGAIAVKWNGLGFTLGIYLTFLVSRLFARLFSISRLSNATSRFSLANLPRLNLWQLGLMMPAIAALVYWLVAIPHLQQNPGVSFWTLQEQMLNYHEGVDHKAHSYCSDWYTWPLMLRPVSYFYQRAATLTEPIPVTGPSLPDSATRVIYDVHAMGNPPLWWFSTLAILCLTGWLGQQVWQRVASRRVAIASSVDSTYFTEEFWVPLFLVVNYAANLLPWAGVSRCLFIYHYMPASIFSLLALAWLLERWLRSLLRWERGMAVTLIFLIFLALVFWLPIYLGLPLSSTGFTLRMWFPTWI